ncbi:MAG TPA: flagellar biosynthesis protein FlhF [bacterium]|nr:flagellar biosynthesis protein FlhF [bacterium]
MQYFTLEAGTPSEAMAKMKQYYGQEARILTHRNVRKGGFMGFFTREGVEITGYVPQRQELPATLATGLGRDYGSVQGDQLNRKRILESAKRQQKQQREQSPKPDQSFQQILKEIQGLRENLAPPPEELTSSMAQVRNIMEDNDFSKAFTEEIMQRIRQDFSLEDLENLGTLHSSVLEWIGERINIHPSPELKQQSSKVIIVVGPTGVGKTTTIAKLAAIYGVGNREDSAPRVKIVTIDNYRIAARQQIKTYAEIMRIPVSFVESGADFKKVLALSVETDLILVDTIGKSPRDYSKLAEMREILDVAGSASETHLAVSATTKLSDVEEILQQFEPFNYKAVILTKLDETTRIGNIISALSGRNKSLSFLADGQSVPQDIAKASVVRLLLNLEGFRINRERLENKFGSIEDKYWS